MNKEILEQTASEIKNGKYKTYTVNVLYFKLKNIKTRNTFIKMSHWGIIRSDTYVDENDEYISDSVLCGLYSSKNSAVDEILKLYIEDNIMVDETSTTEQKVDPTKIDQSKIDTPAIDIEELSFHRQRLLSDEIYNTYTNIGNKYTLVECVIDAKHDFSDDVLALFNKCQ